MSIHVKQHVPGFVHGVTAGEANVESAEYITRLEFIARWEKDNSEELFYQWSLDGHWLIAEYNDGRVWYVTARLSSDDFQPVIRFFPKWVPNRTPAAAKDTFTMQEFYKIPQEHHEYSRLLAEFVHGVPATADGNDDIQRQVLEIVPAAFNLNALMPRLRLQKLLAEQVDNWALLVLTCASPAKSVAYTSSIRKSMAEIALLSFYVGLDDRLKENSFQLESSERSEPVWLPEVCTVGMSLQFETAGPRVVWWRMTVIKEFNVLHMWREFQHSTQFIKSSETDQQPVDSQAQARAFLTYLRDMNYLVPTPTSLRISLSSVMDPRNG